MVAKKGNNVKYVARRVDKFIMLPTDLEVVRRLFAVYKESRNTTRGGPPIGPRRTEHGLKRSLANTLAHRHKWRTATAAFARWGRDRSVSQKNAFGDQVTLCWNAPQMKGNTWKAGSAVQGELHSSILGQQRTVQSCPQHLGDRLLAELKCAIPNGQRCGSQHHKQHRKRLKLEGRRKAIQELTAKQIPIS
jgi:hypothetical protein